jgi:hypothetical protein
LGFFGFKIYVPSGNHGFYETISAFITAQPRIMSCLACSSALAAKALKHWWMTMLLLRGHPDWSQL